MTDRRLWKPEETFLLSFCSVCLRLRASLRVPPCSSPCAGPATPPIAPLLLWLNLWPPATLRPTRTPDPAPWEPPTLWVSNTTFRFYSDLFQRAWWFIIFIIFFNERDWWCIPPLCCSCERVHKCWRANQKRTNLSWAQTETTHLLPGQPRLTLCQFHPQIRCSSPQTCLKAEVRTFC